MRISCCKTPYSIRYTLLHRTVTKQSTKHLLKQDSAVTKERKLVGSMRKLLKISVQNSADVQNACVRSALNARCCFYWEGPLVSTKNTVVLV